jgi:hypothetical protein
MRVGAEGATRDNRLGRKLQLPPRLYTAARPTSRARTYRWRWRKGVGRRGRKWLEAQRFRGRAAGVDSGSADSSGAAKRSYEGRRRLRWKIRMTGQRMARRVIRWSSRKTGKEEGEGWVCLTRGRDWTFFLAVSPNLSGRQGQSRDSALRRIASQIGSLGVPTGCNCIDHSTL